MEEEREMERYTKWREREIERERDETLLRK